MAEGGVNSKWFRNSWGALVLFAMGVHYIAKMDEPFIGDASRWDLLDDIMTWIALAGTFALFVWENVVNWRIGARYFWRRWAKWSTAVGVGVAVGVVIIAIVGFFKSGTIINSKAIWIMAMIVIPTAAAIKFFATYMFKHSGKEDL
ncbi:MAG: hypothetical protein IIW00_06285 [Alistipes sp.]|jgi:hypothetical protein|nr:hypothetical protein [Alistipes sp.]